MKSRDTGQAEMDTQEALPELRPDVSALLSSLAAQPRTNLDEISIEQLRAGLAQLAESFDLPPYVTARSETLDAPSFDGVPIRIRVFDTQQVRIKSSVVVFFHGGSFALGSVEDYASACTMIAFELGLPVVAVEYRLAPEHTWPVGVNDCEAVARCIADQTDLGFEVEGLVLTGDSAGGNLAIVTGLALRDNPASKPVLAICALYPITDQQTEAASYQLFAEGLFLRSEDLRWLLRMYHADRTDWRTSPILANLSGLPPTVIATAEADPLRDEGRAFASLLTAAGVTTVFYEAKGMIHGFLTMRKALPSANRDVIRILDGLRSVLWGRA